MMPFAMLAQETDAATGVVLLLILAALYFLPLIVAIARHVPNVGSVAVIDIFLGWTVIGWVVALAMAVRSVPPTAPQFRPPPPPMPR
jgi:hypothetical protein